MATVKKEYDLIVIGSGPGGYVAAIRASQLGMRVAIVEKDKPGGVCLNIGCIPSKSLIHHAELFTHSNTLTQFGVKIDASTFDYALVQKASRQAADKLSKGVQFLLKKNNIDYINGHGRFADATHIEVTPMSGSPYQIASNYTLIATGSRPREIAGFPFDEKQVFSSTGALLATKLPKSLVILGAGVIGMEFAYIMSSFGVAVTVVELLPKILLNADADFSTLMHKKFMSRGVKFMLNTQAMHMERSAKSITLHVQDKATDSAHTVSAEQLLVAVGRVPNSENLGLKALGIQTENGAIRTADYYRTTISNIYAIGDVIATPQLAHVASKEGEIAVEHMSGNPPAHARFSDDLYPAVVYTDPELAWFGPTEEQLTAQGVAYKSSLFPYRGAGKSVAIGADEGQVKLIFSEAHHALLAAHIYGKHATELIHELLLAKQAELLPEDIANVVHAHPTLSEVTLEVARAAEGWAIHI